MPTPAAGGGRVAGPAHRDRGGVGQVDRRAATILTAMSWLSLGPDMGRLPAMQHTDVSSPELRSLRERIAQQYSAPFDVIFDSPQAADELMDVDSTVAFALLIGPLAFGRISTLAEFDDEQVAVAAVDGFLKSFAKGSGDTTTSASTESEGA